MNLSKNVTLDMFTRSEAGTRAHIEEQFSPEKSVIEAGIHVCENVFEKLFILFPSLHINSGYRCVRVNALLGGAATSQHCKGEALDLGINGDSNIKIAQAFLSGHFSFDQMIVEGGTMEKPAWIHISYKPEGNRNMILRADFNVKPNPYSNLTKEQVMNIKSF